jgi:hypothetical protein
MIPVWLLDIDGVVNACAKKPDRNVWPLDQWWSLKVDVGGHSWPVLVAEPVLAFIRRVHAEGLAEIRWHTTWQQDAKALEEACDLPEARPVVEAAGGGAGAPGRVPRAGVDRRRRYLGPRAAGR